MKNESGTIKTNLELDRVVMGGSGGYRWLPGGSDDFSLQTNTQTDTHHNIYIVIVIDDQGDRGEDGGKTEQGNIELLSQWTMEDCDEQFKDRFPYLAFSWRVLYSQQVGCWMFHLPFLLIPRVL